MEAPEVEVLFEDKYLLAVNKPAGLVIERTGHMKSSLETKAFFYLRAKEKYPQKVFIGLPHRLDRPVTGVVLFAKKRGVLKSLVELFRVREMKKTYYALLENTPPQPEGELMHWHRKNADLRKAELFTEEQPETNRARLLYKVLQQTPYGTFVEVQLITGKFHQIRAQMASMGCPIVGDAFYGAQKPYKENAIALHARRLQFVHPITNQAMSIEAPFPANEFWAALTNPVTGS